MHIFTLVPTAAVVFAIAAMGARAPAQAATRISGPHIHENLAVYFVHGTSMPGPAPLTLAEALARGTVNVIETGSVNELQIENKGDEEVFVQSGDIVKGGKQDRVLTISLVLPAKSGKVPIASFCVEQGRWTARGKEDVAKFASAAEAMPSRAAKLAMRAPSKPVETGSYANATSGRQALRGNDTSDRQRKVWDEVANVQANLSAGLGATVAAPQSASSLQLALENEKLKDARANYLKAFEDKAKSAGDDVVGYVFAVNGALNSADVYPSHALFEKMWPKLINASITEAIGLKSKATAASDAKSAPSTADIEAFLVAAEAGKSEERPIASLMKQETRDSDKTLYIEAKRADGRWVHRNYLAR